MEDKIRGQQHQHPMHVTEESASSGVAAASALASSSKGNFKIRLPSEESKRLVLELQKIGGILCEYKVMLLRNIQISQVNGISAISSSLQFLSCSTTKKRDCSPRQYSPVGIVNQGFIYLLYSSTNFP